MTFFKNKKFIDVVRPFQEFFLYKSFMLVAHGNILSYYDTERESWRCHYHFEDEEEDDDDDFQHMNTRQTFIHNMRKKVINVFRHETKDEGQFGIGVLF